MKKREILQDLLKHDETLSEQMLLEKQHQQTCLMQDCREHSFCKNTTVNCNEMRYA